jgi:tape measure domain-containing protein
MSTLSTNQIVVEYIIRGDEVNKARTAFDKLTEAEKQAIIAALKLNDSLRTTGREGRRAADDVSKSLTSLSGIAGKLTGLLAGAFAISSIKSFSEQVLKTTIEFDTLRKAINFTSGSMEVGSANFNFLKENANQLGISLEAASQGFKTISGAASQAGYSNKQVQEIFLNTSKAISAFGLSAEQSNGVFQALSQIISKGVVSMEELRQQLGERLPGVFAIAAKAMGLTTQELTKLVGQGKITQEEFIIPFTNAMGIMAEKASGIDSAGKAVTRFKNAYDQLLISLGRSADEEVGVIGFVTKRATNLFNYWSKAFETDLQKVENAAGEGYQSTIDSVIKDLPAAEKEAVRLKIIEMQKESQARKKEIQKQLDAEKKRYEQLGFFEKLAEGGIASYYEEQIKAQDLLISKYNGQLKALKELSEIKPPPPPPTTLNEEDIKALKEKFKLEEKRLELLTQIRKIEMDSRAGNLAADKALYDAKLELRRQYTAKGLTFAKEETDLLKAQSKKTGEDLIQQDLKDRMEGKNILDQYHKDSEKSYDEYLANLQKKKLQTVDIDKSANKEFIKDEKEKWQEIINITEAYSQLANNIVQGFATLRQQQAQNELTALNNKYNAELRLAGDNEQKVNELNEKKAQKEREIRTRAFEAQRMAAVAEVVFRVGPIIAQQIAGVITAPLAIASYAAAAAQIGFILAQPTPEFKEGTKGKPFKGGKAIVGEIGKEWVVTTSGQVYETPGVATLVDLPKGSQVIPHNEVIRAERYMGSKLMREGRGDGATGHIVNELISIKDTLSKLPITSLTMDERGFTKKIQTKSRETRILNNRFGN